MDKEQIKAISESIPMEQRFSVEQIVSAAIESYKAELLKEVGEPIYVEGTCEIQNWKWIRLAVDQANEYERWGWKIRKLFTSDQVAAAILKVTGPLDDQLAAAQEEILIERANGDHWSAAYSKWVNTDESARRLIELQDQLAAAQGEIESNKAYFATLLEEQRVQLATAEQRVAEACAEVALERRNYRASINTMYALEDVANEIRHRQWRKFVKEVRDGYSF